MLMYWLKITAGFLFLFFILPFLKVEDPLTDRLRSAFLVQKDKPKYMNIFVIRTNL